MARPFKSESTGKKKPAAGHGLRRMPGALVSKCARGEDESSVRALSPSPLTVERVSA
ncbi:MAG: hypothetical protein ACLT98_17280 [Eggerthellaceae bacterium]